MILDFGEWDAASVSETQRLIGRGGRGKQNLAESGRRVRGPETPGTPNPGAYACMRCEEFV
jgi:hypothetical protein